MSVSVRDPAPNDRVEYAHVDESVQSTHPRSVVVAAAVATLAVISGPLLAAVLGFVDRIPVEEGRGLTSLAERVLDELPGAFESDGLVVVPAAVDPSVVWSGPVTPDRVDGWVVDLDVNGLTAYGTLPFSSAAPGWLFEVGSDDRVFSDVGPLSFACMRWPGAQECTGALFMENAGHWYVYRSGLDVGGSAEDIRIYRALDGGLPTQLILGGLPHGATTAMVTLAGGDQIAARLSEPGGVNGQTIWWLSVVEPIESVSFLDAEYDVLQEVQIGD
jgi:hypothetical protein